MNRRDLITLLGGAAAWPMAARGQQRPMPVIGVLTPGYRPSSAPLEAAFRQGLGETGFVEGRNVSIEYRWAEGQFERIPALAADLVQRRLAVIFAGGPPAVRALKTLTTTIPVVFSMGEDPVKEGLVANLYRPGGNITGFSYFANLLFAKRLGLLHECVPKDAAFGFLVNPKIQMPSRIPRIYRSRRIRLGGNCMSSGPRQNASSARLLRTWPDFESAGFASISICFSLTGASKSLRLQNADQFLRFMNDENTQLRVDL